MVRTHRRRLVVTIAVAALAAGIAAVVIGVSQSADDGGTIRFAYQNRVGSAACILAVEKGFFADEGLRVEPFRFSSGPACAEALYTGSADVGTMGDTTAIITVARGRAFTIIASHGRGEHRHRLMVGRNSQIRSPRDLAGRTIGVKMGTSTYGGFLAFLASNGLARDRVRVVDMGPSEMPDALAAGSIDAFVASEPTPSLAETRGARQLATMGGLGNSYPLLVLTRSEMLADRPEDIRRFLRALRRGVGWIREQPEDAAKVLTNATGLPSDVARKAMARHAYSLCLDEDIIKSLRKTAAFLKQQRIIDRLPDLRRAADGLYLQAGPR